MLRWWHLWSAFGCWPHVQAREEAGLDQHGRLAVPRRAATLASAALFVLEHLADTQTCMAAPSRAAQPLVDLRRRGGIGQLQLEEIHQAMKSEPCPVDRTRRAVVPGRWLSACVVRPRAAPARSLHHTGGKSGRLLLGCSVGTLESKHALHVCSGPPPPGLLAWQPVHLHAVPEQHHRRQL